MNNPGINNIFAVILFHYYLPYLPSIIFSCVILGLLLCKRNKSKLFLIICILPLIILAVLLVGMLAFRNV